MTKEQYRTPHGDFIAYKSRFGLWQSSSMEDEPLVTSLTKEDLLQCTASYLKAKKEGWDAKADLVGYSSYVGGKL